MSNERKVSHLTRMSMHGWFDILVRAICIGLVFGLIALVGQISYVQTAATYTAEMGEYEREQALNWFARNRSFMLTLCAGFVGFGIIGLLLILPYYIWGNWRSKGITDKAKQMQKAK